MQRAMIHVISSTNRHLYEDAIETHFHIRHDTFVGERRWKGLARADGKEIDCYDHVDTVYKLSWQRSRSHASNFSAKVIREHPLTCCRHPASFEPIAVSPPQTLRAAR
jgi:hypothetical protein